MSHTGPTVPLAVRPLAIAVSFSAGLGPLITAAGSALLQATRCRSTFLPAVALTTITRAAHKEQGTAARCVTDPRTQGRLGHRHLSFSGHLITITCIADDRTDDRAFGADYVVGTPYAGKHPENYVF
jgi:hypothetical protein